MNFKVGDIIKWDERKEKWKITKISSNIADITCIYAVGDYWRVGQIVPSTCISNAHLVKIKPRCHPLTTIFKD